MRREAGGARHDAGLGWDAPIAEEALHESLRRRHVGHRQEHVVPRDGRATDHVGGTDLLAEVLVAVAALVLSGHSLVE